MAKEDKQLIKDLQDQIDLINQENRGVLKQVRNEDYVLKESSFLFDSETD